MPWYLLAGQILLLSQAPSCCLQLSLTAFENHTEQVKKNQATSSSTVDVGKFTPHQSGRLVLTKLQLNLAAPRSSCRASRWVSTHAEVDTSGRRAFTSWVRGQVPSTFFRFRPRLPCNTSREILCCRLASFQGPSCVLYEYARPPATLVATGGLGLGGERQLRADRVR